MPGLALGTLLAAGVADARELTANEKMAVHVTVRGSKAEELLHKGLKVKEFELRKKNFSNEGNIRYTKIIRF